DVGLHDTYLGLKEVNRRAKLLPAEQGEKLLEEEQYRLVPAQWEPIIDQQTWDRAEALREANKRHRNATTPAMHHDYVLTGIVRCHSCGHTLEGGGAKGQRYHYYRHPKGKKNSTCRQGAYRAEVIEGAVLGRLRRYVDDDELLEAIISKANTTILDGVQDIERQVVEARRRVGRLEDDRDRYMGHLMTAPAEQVPATYWNKAQEMEADIEDAQRGLEQLERSLEEAKATRISSDAFKEALRQFDRVFDKLNPHEQRQLLAHFLDSVELDGGEAHIALFGEEPNVNVVINTKKECGNQYRTPSNWLPICAARPTPIPESNHRVSTPTLRNHPGIAAA
ncbi:MAG: recombinase zinc beta ribbon domain-containing protein, partial [Proteobacteria bacterium]|nr:recombinase zinc beta ribbon domain-containing protein [Pseudomonadota bacterium]